MPDHEHRSPNEGDAIEFSPEQRAALAEFADTLRAARAVRRALAWIGGIALGLAALVYYIINALAGWNGLHHK
jgi:hypothetical protein